MKGGVTMRAFILTMTMLAGALVARRRSGRPGGGDDLRRTGELDIRQSSTGWFVNLIFAPLPSNIVSFPWIVMWLVVGATVFTFYFGFIQFRAFGHSISAGEGRLFRPERRR